MRGMRSRRGIAVATATVLALLVLGASTAVVVALAGHRPPPAVAVGTRPLPPAPSTAATAPPTPAGPTGAVAGASATATPVSSTSGSGGARSAPSTVRVDESSEAVTIPVGTLLDVELHGDPADRWSEPDTSTPALLQRLSGSADPSGDARATFRALAAGDAVVMIERSTTCTSGPHGGVCGVEARRIAVTVTA